MTQVPHCKNLVCTKKRKKNSIQGKQSCRDVQEMIVVTSCFYHFDIPQWISNDETYNED